MPTSKGEGASALSLPPVADLSLREAALAYAEAGIPIFPLAVRTKRPIIMGGFTLATTDTTQISTWWGEHPQANIGAVPGHVGCIVPDIDTVEARRAWFEHVPIETASTQTGGGIGVHPWYRSSALAGRSHWRLDEHGGPFKDDRLANLLFRASGGYVVVAPSVHPDTDQPYRLTKIGVPIQDLPPDIEKMLTSIPAKQAGGGHTASPQEAALWFETHSREMSEGGASILKQRIEHITSAPKDTRNDTMMAEVGVLLNAAYRWPIDLVAAREQVLEAYVPMVADVRRKAQAEREVNHAFDYVATQRHWEGPLEEAVGGVPISPNWEKFTPPPPRTPEDFTESLGQEAIALQLDIAALLRGELPQTDWMVEGIVPRHRLTAFVAMAKSGKSLFLLDMAAALSTGTPLFNLKHEPMHVLYIDYEMVPEDVAQRLRDMGYGQDESTALLLAENLHYLQNPILPPLDTEEGGQALLKAARMVNAELVIVDTLAAAVAGAENDSDTYRDARRYTWSPLKTEGITVVRVDHLGKDLSAGARGSSMKRDDVDLNWELSAMAGEKLLFKRTHSRLLGVQEKIEIARRTMPLRHVRTGSLIWTADALHLAKEIQKANISIDSPRLDTELRLAGIPHSSQTLQEARAYIEQGSPGVDANLATVFKDSRGEVVADLSPADPRPPNPGNNRRLPTPFDVT